MKNRFVTFSRGCRVALAVAAASVLAQPALAELSGESLVPFMMTKSGKTADEVSKWSDAPLCFDNVKFTSDGSKCWRSQISNSPSITFSLPEEYDELFCVGYRIHRLSTGWYSRDRSPTAWTVEVSDGESWLRVDSRSGVVWQGTQTTNGQGGTDPDEPVCSQEFSLAGQVSFRKIRFTPTESVRHAATPEANDVGLMEIEYFVRDAERMTMLSIVSDPQVAGLSPACGEYSAADIGESLTCTAPERAFGADSYCKCVGYRLEEWNEALQDWSLVTDSPNRVYDCPADGVPRRLTWRWETLAYAVAVSVDDGKESVAYSREADFTDAAGVRYYNLGSTVDVTVEGVTEPTLTTFKEFTGATAGTTAVGSRITIPADRPRFITAQFNRHWKYYLDETAGTGRLTDGNWVFRVTGFNKAVGGYAAYGTLRFGTSASTTDTYVSGRGRFDMTLINDDMIEQAKTYSGTGPRPIVYLLSQSFKDNQAITELVVPSSIVGYENGLFSGCSNLVSVVFAAGESECSVQEWAIGIFQNCIALEKVTLEGVKTIWMNMFANCIGLRTVTFPATLQTINSKAFYRSPTFSKYDEPLTTFVFLGGVPATVATDWCGDDDLQAFRFAMFVPVEQKDEWMTSARFTAKGSIAGETHKPFYNEVSACGRRYLGAWGGQWLLTSPRRSGLVILLR